MRTTYIGTTTFRHECRRFGIRTPDRRRHLYCIGKTGTGKTTLLRNLIVQDIEAGRGVGVIDPHGDLANEILEFIPRSRTRHTVYLDPADLEHPVGFNVLGRSADGSAHLVAASVVEALKSIWHRSWGPRLEFLLFNSVAALADVGGMTLLDLVRFLTDERFRAQAVGRVADPVVRGFWSADGAATLQLRPDAVAPVLNKVGQFLTSAPIRHVVGQRHARFNVRHTMDEGGILIANLGQGTLGHEQATLLGALLVAHFGIAAMSRADVPEHERRDFVLYIDEFHEFSTRAFASILAATRKYRLSLVLAHQYLDQLTPAVRSAVFGNVGSWVAFRVGEPDAAVLAREFGAPLQAADFANLPQFGTYIRLSVDGMATPPFSAETEPPWAVGRHAGRAKQVRRNSRRRFGRARGEIEREITRGLRRGT